MDNFRGSWLVEAALTPGKNVMDERKRRICHVKGHSSNIGEERLSLRRQTKRIERFLIKAR